MKDRKFILYIVIIVFIASLGTLTYRVGSSIKAKKDAIIEEYNKEKQEIKDKQKKAEEEAKRRQEFLRLEVVVGGSRQPLSSLGEAIFGIFPDIC